MGDRAGSLASKEVLAVPTALETSVYVTPFHHSIAVPRVLSAELKGSEKESVAVG